jgi:hypothetical protein
LPTTTRAHGCAMKSRSTSERNSPPWSCTHVVCLSSTKIYMLLFLFVSAICDVCLFPRLSKKKHLCLCLLTPIDCSSQKKNDSINECRLVFLFFIGTLFLPLNRQESYISHKQCHDIHFLPS